MNRTKCIFYVLLTLLLVGCNKEKDFEYKKYNIKAIETVGVVSVGRNSSEVIGRVETDKGELIKDAGVVYKDLIDPNAIEVKVTSADNIAAGGTYKVVLTDLIPDTKYSVKAYATNNLGTAYGKEITFTTEKAVAARFSNLDTANVTRNTVDLTFSITDNGGYPVTSKGVLYSATNQVPLATNSSRSETDTEDESVTINLTGLMPGTKYYIRAFAITEFGMSVGDVISVETKPIVPPYDIEIKHIYKDLVGDLTVFANVTNDGGSPITWKGFLMSKSQPVTASNSVKISSASNVGEFSTILKAHASDGMEPGTVYYIAPAAENIAGLTIGPTITFETRPIIGQYYKGGVVAYLLNSSDSGYERAVPHGLIIYSEATYGTWGCEGVNIGLSTGFGSGFNNTNTIINVCGEQSAAAAAKKLNAGGYTDWYLPSLDEIKKIYQNKSGLWLTGHSNVWTSSDVNATSVYSLNFSDGRVSNMTKNSYGHSYFVRRF